MQERAKRGRCEIGPILADDLTDEQLNKLAGVKFTPKPAQLVYARAYVSAAPKDSLRAIAELSGVPFETVRNWRRQPLFRTWLADVAIFAVGTVMGRVWRAVADKAAEGNIPAAKMLALRFDREFADLLAHREPPKPEHTDAELAEIAAAAAKAEPLTPPMPEPLKQAMVKTLEWAKTTGRATPKAASPKEGWVDSEPLHPSSDPAGIRQALREAEADAQLERMAEGLAFDPLALVTEAPPETGQLLGGPDADAIGKAALTAQAILLEGGLPETGPARALDGTLERNKPQEAPRVPCTAKGLSQPSTEFPRGAGGEGQANVKHNMSLPPATHDGIPDTPAVSSKGCLAPGTIIPCFDTRGVRLETKEDR